MLIEYTHTYMLIEYTHTYIHRYMYIMMHTASLGQGTGAYVLRRSLVSASCEGPAEGTLSADPAHVLWYVSKLTTVCMYTYIQTHTCIMTPRTVMCCATTITVFIPDELTDVASADIHGLCTCFIVNLHSMGECICML